MQQSAATAAVYHSHLRPARSLPDIRIGLPVSLRYLTVAPLWTIERQLACVIGQVGFHATPRRWKRIEDHCQQVLFVVRPYHSPVRFVNFASLLDGELIRAWHEYNRQSSCWLMSTTLVFKEWNFFKLSSFFYFLLSNCITFLRIQIHDFHVFKSCASNTYFVSPFFFRWQAISVVSYRSSYKWQRSSSWRHKADGYILSAGSKLKARMKIVIFLFVNNNQSCHWSNVHSP